MSFLNIGNKDEFGRQTRIEHRGRYLRASRTGGVALRAETKAAGLNFTGNTAHGFRVSTTPAKNTQLAFQNGRFVLRGRYGSGPTKLNLSKTGVTVSTRNRLGTFNWVKPNRSSAKIAGVQVRGKNAVILQSIYLAFSAIGLLFQMLIAGARMATQAVIFLMRGLAWGIRVTPPAIRLLWRAIQNARLKWEQRRLDQGLVEALDGTTDQELRTITWLIFSQWGSGLSVSAGTAKSPADPGLATDEVNDTDPSDNLVRARTLLKAIERDARGGNWHLAYLAAVAATLSWRLANDERATLLLNIDEALVEEAPRTVLQDRMIEVYADFAGLQLEHDQDVTRERPTDPAQPTSAPAATEKINLNTATRSELQTLPHIGSERARSLIEMRPITSVDELREIDGIGPARLEEIKSRPIEL